MSNKVFSFGDIIEIFAEHMKGRAILTCPCSTRLFENATEDEWKKHIKHVLYWGVHHIDEDDDEDIASAILATRRGGDKT